MIDKEYKPDGWCIIKHAHDKGSDYYVFASWSDGYLYGDSWKRNSGITKVEEDGDDYLFHGYTGSVYRCSKHGEGRISGYNGGILNQICESNNARVVSVSEIKLS